MTFKRVATLALALATFGIAETFEVKMLNRGAEGPMVFEPAALRIAPGDTVKFLATDRGHNAETIKDLLPDGAEPFVGKLNEEIEVTFDVEGFYAIKCEPHFAMGMVMIIAVGDGSVDADAFLQGRIPKRAKERLEAQISGL